MGSARVRRRALGSQPCGGEFAFQQGDSRLQLNLASGFGCEGLCVEVTGARSITIDRWSTRRGFAFAGAVCPRIRCVWTPVGGRVRLGEALGCLRRLLWVDSLFDLACLDGVSSGRFRVDRLSIAEDGLAPVFGCMNPGG